MNIFRGFSDLEKEYPRYSVVTPQTGYSYEVKAFNNFEVETLKTSMNVSHKAISALNEFIYKSLKSKPANIDTLDKFKKSCTLKDREALLFGNYITTFGDEREFNILCEGCEKRSLTKVRFSDMFEINAYPVSEQMKSSYKISKVSGEVEVPDPEIENSIAKDDNKKSRKKEAEKLKKLYGIDVPDISKEDEEEFKNSVNYVEKPATETKEQNIEEKEEENPDSILNKVHKFNLKTFKSIVVTIKQPTMWDEEKAFSSSVFSKSKAKDLITETLFIVKFERYDKTNQTVIDCAEQREDIILGYNQLLDSDRLYIMEQYRDVFGQYGIKLKFNFVCPQCGYEDELNFDILSHFLRNVRNR